MSDRTKALHVPDTRHLLRGAHPRTQHVWKGTFMRSGRRTKASLLDYARAAAIFKTRTHMVATVRGSTSTTRTLSRMQSTPLLAISTTQTQRLTIDRRHPVARPAPYSASSIPARGCSVRDELLKNKSDKSVQWTVQWVDGIDGMHMLAREVELSIQFYVPAWLIP